MLSTRTFAVRLSLALVSAAGVASILALGGIFSCSTYPTYKEVPPDCTVEAGYEFAPFEDFSSAETQWWSSADESPGLATVANTSMPDMCGSTSAGVFTVSDNYDWGCVFGMWAFNVAKDKGRDASQWDGISFWARVPGKGNKSFTLILDDDNTFSVPKEDEATSNTRCRTYPTDGGSEGVSNGVVVTVVATDPGTGTPITGSSNTRAAYPDECGNGFLAIVDDLTSEWRLHKIPWSEFKQSATPNRVPNEVFPVADAGPVDHGSMLLTSSLRNLTMRMIKGAQMNLWMTKLSFYREKAQ